MLIVFSDSLEGGLPGNQAFPPNPTRNQPGKNTTPDNQRLPVSGRNTGIQRVPSAGTLSNVSMEDPQNHQRQGEYILTLLSGLLY